MKNLRLREVEEFASNHTTSQLSSCFVKGSGQIWSWTGLGIEVSTLSLPHCVTLGELLSFSGLQFPHPQNGERNSSKVIRWGERSGPRACQELSLHPGTWALLSKHEPPAQM